MLTEREAGGGPWALWIYDSITGIHSRPKGAKLPEKSPPLNKNELYIAILILLRLLSGR